MRTFAENGPPLFITMASYAGWKPQPKAQAVSGEDMDAVMRSFLALQGDT